MAAKAPGQDRPGSLRHRTESCRMYVPRFLMTPCIPEITWGAESDLVEHYGVSRGPVRDALRTLEAIGVVDIRVGAHGGIFVASGDPTRFSNTLAVQLKLMQVGRNDLLESLSAIEEFAVDLASRSATQEELNRLSEIIRSLKDISDPEEFTSLSFRVPFHGSHCLSQSRAGCPC